LSDWREKQHAKADVYGENRAPVVPLIAQFRRKQAHWFVEAERK
jgi:hypothetical protein